MAMAAGESVTEAELADLRQKFQLLEGDRKAYYEMSMHTMKENKRAIAQLRDDNKELRKKLSGVQRQARSAVEPGSELGSDKELRGLEKHVMTLRKNHDTIKSTVDAKRDKLRKLRDEAATLELEARRPSAEDSPLTRKIRLLENRLDKAMIKFNEAQSIRKTYEQIVKRLREERVGFDNQLGAIERTLQAKKHDYDELLLLSGDANHAREVAQADLERSRNMIADSRKTRDRELRAKKDIVEARSDMVSRLEKREQMRSDIIAKANGDLSEEEEKQLKTSLAVSTLTQKRIAEDSKHQRAKIDIFEEAFRKIKDATGVSDVNEVIQKIISQEDTQRNLKDLTRENQEKIEHLQVDKVKLVHRVEEIKYSGTGGGHRRKMVDDHEESLAQSIAKLERCRLRYERLAKILINVKAGVNHLADKLEAVQQDSKHIVMNDDTVVDVLVACENTLCTILSKVREYDGDLSSVDLKNVLLSSIEDEEMVASRRFNQRVALPDHKDELRADSRNDDVEGADLDNIEIPLDEDGEEELTRDRIKKAAITIVQTHERKTRRKNKQGAEPSQPRQSGAAFSPQGQRGSVYSPSGGPTSPASGQGKPGRRNRGRGPKK